MVAPLASNRPPMEWQEIILTIAFVTIITLFCAMFAAFILFGKFHTMQWLGLAEPWTRTDFMLYYRTSRMTPEEKERKWADYDRHTKEVFAAEKRSGWGWKFLIRSRTN